MSALDDIVYIRINDTLSNGNVNGIDPSVPLPVRRDDGGQGGDGAGAMRAADITVERVLSGILTVAAHDKHNENLPYYKRILLEVRPNIKKELCEAAILKARNEEWDDADEMFLSLMTLFGDDMAVVLNRALYLDERASSYRRSSLNEDADAFDSEALSLYRKAMDAPDPLPDAFFNAGFFYMKSHSYKEARSCFETYVALTLDVPDDVLGENGIYKRERAQSVADYIRARAVDDEHFQKAYGLINSGREEEGLEEIHLFLKENPAVWNAWFMLGWALRKLERYSEARDAFEQAIEIARGERTSGEEWKEALCDTYNELAICLIECGSLSDAKGALLKALSIDSENAKVMSNLGFVAMKEGNIGEARGYFLSALEYDKDDKIAQSALASLEK